MKQRTISIEGTEIYFIEAAGSGPPLILLHGIGWSSDDYLSVIPRLQEIAHVFALDMRGHGRSAHVSAPYTVRAYAQDVRGFLADVIGEPAILAGFSLGSGVTEHVVHYADREKPGGKRKSVTIGEIDGETRDRTQAIKSLFETAGIPVDLSQDIDGWLKYHVALVNPLVNALYKHDCDNYALAKDKATMRAMVRAAKEGGRVLHDLGYTKRQPFQFNLFYWLPEILNVKAIEGLLGSKFAEVAFARHARAARDEMGELADEFQSLVEQTSIATPNINLLRNYVD